MKKIILWGLFLFTSSCFAVMPTQQLGNLLSGVKSMQANFIQTVNGKAITGTMALQRPGKFRWQVQKPNRQLIIADGNKIWIYEPDLEQVIEQQMDAKLSVNPAMLLTGSIKDLQNYFVVSKMANNSFMLQPKQKNSMFQKIVLQFNNNILISMIITDNLGNQTNLSFTKIKTNLRLPGKLFKFTVPQGVDVVKS